MTFREVLVYIAGFALSNQLVRLDHQFKVHLFEPGYPFYDFKRGQVKAINQLYKTAVKKVHGYVFVDRSCGDEGGMIRWYEEGGQPQVFVLSERRKDPRRYGLRA